jgi:Phytanoyl-CoA dioxygenase (PhyH)
MSVTLGIQVPEYRYGVAPQEIFPALAAQARRADFNEYGYLRVPRVLSRDEAAHYKGLVLDLIPRDLDIPFPWRSAGGRIKPYHDGYGEQATRYGHEDDAIWDTPEFIPLLCNELAYQAAATLIGRTELRVQDGTIGITLRNDDRVFQPGGTRESDVERSSAALSQPLHVDPSIPDDVENFTFAPSELQVGAVFYLTDVEPLGGGIHVVPGGHKLVQEACLRDRGGRRLHSGWTNIKDFPATTEVTGEAGDLILTHYLLPHAASHNRRARARFAYFIRYSCLDHPFFPPPAPAVNRFNMRQLKAMSPAARRMLGADPW